MAHLQAKSGGDAPLFDHLCNVAWQAQQFLAAYKPAWPSAPDGSLARILAYASLLHDFGKIHPAFQAALLPNGAPFKNRHEVLSVAFLEWLVIPQAEVDWIAAAIVTHHRGWLELRERYAGDGSNEHSDLAKLARGVAPSDEALLHEVLQSASQIFRFLGWPRFEPYPVREYHPIDYRAGIQLGVERLDLFLKSMLPPIPRRPGARPSRDWRGPLGAIQTRGWLLSADHLASFKPHPVRTAVQSTATVQRLYPDFNWASHQLAAGEHTGSGLLIAPTGSGKTEAALLWAGHQAECGAHGRLSILLPYQTSLNAMHSRLISRLDPANRDRPESWNETVGLLHGRASRHLYENFLKFDHAPGAALKAARQQNELARLFAAPVAVSTVFSVIRLLFATRGAERLFAVFTGARIVIDEIHAYAPEVTALTLATLRFLVTHLGARILFMSATVPDHLKAALTSTIELSAIPEPISGKPRHRLRLLPFASNCEDAVSMVIEASRRGSVLLVVNQVKRAIDLWRRIRPHAECRILHSRFHSADRPEIESALAPRPGLILVATQAVEVSLDLDFDTCFSELAPLESLVQRFGRCNRRGSQDGTASVFVFSEFPSGRSPHLPYDAEHVTAVARVMSETCSGMSVDLEELIIRAMLTRSYPESLRDELNVQITDKVGRVTKAFLDEWKPFGLDSGEERKILERQWEELFDGNEVLPEACLTDALAQPGWLAASRYLVPISGRQFHRFRSEIRWNEDLSMHVISRPYGSAGLDLHSGLQTGEQ